MYGQQFYNETTRRYVALFGTLFNDIKIDRIGPDNVRKRMTVPINYAPYQKILARLDQDPDLDAPAMTLPRMSFEILGMTYAPDRKLPRKNKIRRANANIDSGMDTIYNPTPYDIEFQLNIMTKLNEDGTKILEQIVPYFAPDVTHSVKLIDQLDLYLDIPIVLTGVSLEDSYEGDFETRRALVWTLSFTMKGYFFGPTTNKKIIKFANADAYPEIDPTLATYGESIQVQPGLTANNEPTTSLTQTVNYSDINSDDDWDYIVSIEDIPDGP